MQNNSALADSAENLVSDKSPDATLEPADALAVLEKDRESEIASEELALVGTDKAGYDLRPEHVPGALLDWSTLGQTRAPRVWFVKGWLTTGPTLYAARGGLGKSLEMQTMCTAIATGRDFLGQVDEARHCLIWSCEDEIDELLFRQDCINKRHRLTKADLGKLHVNPRIGLDSTLMENVNGKLVETPVLAELRKQLNATGAQVLVLDNVAHIYGGLDDRTQVTKFVRTVSSLVTDRPFATIFVTHVPKGQSSDYAGTIAWENAVRMRWLLEQGENDDLKKSIGKSNVAGLTFANLRIVDSVMVALNDRQIAEARQKEAEKQKARLESAEQVLVSGLEKIVKEKGKYPVYKRRSQESLVTLIISHDLAATASKQELEAAWDRIEREGRFATSRPTDSLTGKPWVYSNGTPKFAIERIVPSGKGDPVDSMVTASEL